MKKNAQKTTLEARGFSILGFQRIGKISGNSVLPKRDYGMIVNDFYSVYNRTYTDANGARHNDGVFETFDHAEQELDKIACLKFQYMLKKGFREVSVRKTRGKSRICIRMLGKKGDIGWLEQLSLQK